MRKVKTKRQGTAATETAVVLPLVVLVMLGSVEICGGIHQQYRAQGVLHQCAKFAAKGETTSAALQARADSLMQSMDFNTYTIQMDVVPRTANVNSVETPTVTSFTFDSSGFATPGLDEVPRGTLLRMSVTADRPSIGAGMTRYMGATIQADFVFVKEI